MTIEELKKENDILKAKVKCVRDLLIKMETMFDMALPKEIPLKQKLMEAFKEMTELL